MDPVVIRPCKPEDIDGVLRLEKASFSEPYDRSTFDELLESGTTLVAEASGDLVGYVAVTSAAGLATIVSIATAPARRREGIASMLMRSALQGLDGRVARVLLQVDVNNLAAISLYARFGFRQTGIIRRYYRNGDDAFVMSLDLAKV